MMHQSEPAASQNGWGPGLWWLLLLGGLAGLLFPISKMLAGLQDGDGILASLISTQKLTWYFWGQDRLLNFLPALAFPIAGVEANAHFQIFLRAFMAFLAPVGILVLIQKNRRSLFFATVIASFFLIISISDQYGLFNLYVQHNPFGTSLVLWGLSAAILQDRRGAAGVLAAVATAFLAYATNIALLLLMLPMLVFLLRFERERRHYLSRLLMVQMVAIAIAVVHARIFGEPATSPGINPSWPAVLVVWKTLSTHLHLAWLGVLGAASAMAAILLRTRQAWLALALAAAMPMAVTALSALLWVQINLFNIRYFLVFVLAYCTFCACIWTALLSRMLKTPVQAVAAAGCFAYAFMVKLGGFSPQPGEIVGTAWRSQARASASVAVRENVNLITGGFWDAWPVVFFANVELQQRGAKGTAVYGVAQRGHVLREKLLGQVAQAKKVKALCLVDSIDKCEEITKDFLIKDASFQIVRPTVQLVKIGKKTGLLYDIAPVALTPVQLPVGTASTVDPGVSAVSQIDIWFGCLKKEHMMMLEVA